MENKLGEIRTTAQAVTCEYVYKPTEVTIEERVKELENKVTSLESQLINLLLAINSLDVKIEDLKKL